MTMSIPEATQRFLDIHNIRTRDDLNSKKRAEMYDYVSIHSAEHWQKVKEPKSHVRWYYESKLYGYKLYQGQIKKVFPQHDMELIEEVKHDGMQSQQLQMSHVIPQVEDIVKIYSINVNGHKARFINVNLFRALRDELDESKTPYEVIFENVSTNQNVYKSLFLQEKARLKEAKP